MIQPSALPITPALSPVATASAIGPATASEAGENGEISAGFAALLGIQIEATAGEERPAASVTDFLTPEAASAKPGPEGKTSPEVSPPVPGGKEEEPGHEIAGSVASDPALSALPVFQPALPAAATAAPVLPSVPNADPAPLAASPAAAPALPVPALSRAEAQSDPVTQAAAALPQVRLTVHDDKPDTPADPIRTFTAAPLVDVLAAPAATFQPVAAPPQAVATPATSQPHARHDFTALVDRLVEARDAALTVQTPQSVAAAVIHSEFGEVAIRFEHRGDALSVSLTNADPDFTRAVQAAAPASQTGAAGDNSAQPQRQEGGGQNLAPGSGNSSQSQSQQRQGTPATRGAIQQEHDGEQQQPANGGIFA